MEVRPVKKRADPDHHRQGPLRGPEHQPPSRGGPGGQGFGGLCAPARRALSSSRTKRELAAEFTYRDTPQFAEARRFPGSPRNCSSGRRGRRGCRVHQLHFHPGPEAGDPAVAAAGEIKAVSADVTGDSAAADLEAAKQEYLFEPARARCWATCSHYLNYQVYQFLQEAKASGTRRAWSR